MEQRQQARQQIRQQPQQRQGPESNVIYVGKKNSMLYVMAAMTQFGAGHAEVRVKGRGNSISKCVDVTEILRNKFLPMVKVKNINIGTEQMKAEGGNMIGVSTMEIILAK